MTIGEKIKLKRKELKLTQEELAKLVGYTSKTTINKIEKNKIEAPLEKLNLIAQVLKVSPQYLTGWEINYDTKILNEEQIRKLEEYIESSNSMYFSGSIDNKEESKEIVREALTKAYIEILKGKGEI